MKRVLSLVLTVLISASLLLILNPKKVNAGDNKLVEAENLLSLNNQTGVHYSTFDAVSVQTVNHGTKNQFIGLTLNNLETDDLKMPVVGQLVYDEQAPRHTRDRPGRRWKHSCFHYLSGTVFPCGGHNR